MGVTTAPLTYVQAFDIEFERLMDSGKAFSANDLRDRISVNPSSPNQVGTLWLSRIRRYRNELALVGIVKSTAPRANSSMIMEYQVRKETNQ